MSYTLKQRFSFLTLQGDTVRVDFYREGAAAGLRILDPGPQPFVLKEYNGDADLFKPTRGILAEIQILNINGVQMDDFIADQDSDVQVQAYFNGTEIWTGWLIQDDFQEPWIDTAHYITLRATDGLGTITGKLNMGATGQATILDFLVNPLEDTPLGSGLLDKTIVCNLFYDGMLDRADGENTALLQTTADVRTFEGEDKAKVLEKTLRAWGMNLYQYRSKWWFNRIEEYIQPLPVQGMSVGLSASGPFSKTFYVNIGRGEAIQAIVPEMLRSRVRPAKNTRINFFYRFPREIVCNQTFQSGALIIPTTDNYSIDCWTIEKAPLSAPVAGTADFYRVEELDGDGNVTDNYAFIQSDAALHWARSEPFYINENDVFEIALDFRGQRNTTTGPNSVNIVIVQLLTNGGARYTLDDDGTWNLATGTWAGNIKNLTMHYSATENTGDWKNYRVRSKAAPAGGQIEILLQNVFSTDTDANFKGLEIEIRESSKQPGVAGDYDQYTLPGSGTINRDYLEETFMDDSNNRQHKGALFFDGDLTGDNWYRMDYSTERLTFKRQKAIGHMLLNRRGRSRIQVTMRGLTWDDAGTSRPIWLQNRFIFVDDAPTKTWMIGNLEELNFAEGTWKATLIEVWDTELDDADPANYPLHTFGNIYEKDV